MRRALIVGLAVALTLAAPPVGRGEAQSTSPAGDVTVDELVTRAVGENPDIRAAQADVEAARGRLIQAGLRPNPMLELGGQKGPSTHTNPTVRGPLPPDRNGRHD